MNDALSAAALLVAGPYPVTVGDRGEAPRPTEILVFTTGDGSVFELSKRPGALSGAKYSYRYVVDCGDHRADWAEELPSGTGGFGFQAVIEARWRVESAAEVVRRKITAIADGESVVRSAVRELLWPHAACYGIEDLGDLSAFVRSGFYGRTHHLDEGLVVTGLSVRLHLDPLAVEHLRQVKQREFDRQLAQAQHLSDKQRQVYDHELLSQREEAILAAARGEGGLILRMIAQEPHKMREILDDLARRHDITMDRKQQVLSELIDKKLIQPAEAHAVWQEMHQPVPLFGAGAPAVQAPAHGAHPQVPTQAPATPIASKPPAPRFQGGAGQQAAGNGPSPAAPNAPAPSAQPASGQGAGPGAANPAPGNVVGEVPVGPKRPKRSGG